MFGLSPPLSACSRISTWPFLAASNRRVANARAAGGRLDADGGGVGAEDGVGFERVDEETRSWEGEEGMF